MGLIRKVLGKPPLESYLRRARARMVAADFDQAQRIVADGQSEYPDAEPLRELELTIRRAQARAGMQSLRTRIANQDEPRAYEELIALYLELGLIHEARREALAYASAHPDRDMPHLLIGEMSLQAFFDHLQARDAHVAHQRLVRAAGLNRIAVRPRLLLAEMFYCVGADRELLEVVRELQNIASEDPLLEPLLERVQEIRVPDTAQGLHGRFERIEVDGALVRPPSTWPISQRRERLVQMDEDRAQRAAEALVQRGAAAEVVLMQRNGTLLAHATQGPVDEELLENPSSESGDGLVDVSRVVSKTVSLFAHDLDLGTFKRCTIQGDFGVVAVGEIGGVVTGARWPSRPEPGRLWDRIAVDLEGSLGGSRR